MSGREEPTRLTLDMAALIRQMAHQLRKHGEKGRADAAVHFLRSHGLQGSPLRESAAEVPTDLVLVPREAPLALLQQLTGYDSVGWMEREHDRNTILERLRTRWAAILEVAASPAVSPRQVAHSSDERSQLSVNARRAGAEMALPNEQNPVSRSPLPNRSVLPREPS